MTDLAHRLGMSKKLRFHDVYSISDPEMLAMIPRPVYALLTTIPMTEAWKQDRIAEDAQMQLYQGSGPEEPVVWFKQTIIDGCGLIGLLHCLYNGVPSEMIAPGSELATFLEKAMPLQMDKRAKLLGETESLFEASEAAACEGDTEVWKPSAGPKMPNHFVALVQGKDGALWELEGDRRGPLNRGYLEEGQDALSDRALELGIKRLINIQQGADDNVRFSCIALALST